MRSTKFSFPSLRTTRTAVAQQPAHRQLIPNRRKAKVDYSFDIMQLLFICIISVAVGHYHRVTPMTDAINAVRASPHPTCIEEVGTEFHVKVLQAGVAPQPSH